MKQLPSEFLFVNHEGLHRAYISMEQVCDFEQFVSKYVKHKLLMLKYIGFHPHGTLHLGVHTQNNTPIVVLEAHKGTMTLKTHYHLVKDAVEETQWLSPRFIPDTGGRSFELACEFDFEVAANAGLKIFFAVNWWEHVLQSWAWFNKQIYRVPFANVFDTGNICLGHDAHDTERIYDPPYLASIDRLMMHLSSSTWNADAFHTAFVQPVTQLIRFDCDSMKMLPPIPSAITQLPIMAQPSITEITRLIYG